VDSRNLLQHLEDHKPEHGINEALQQIAFSDLILLNKIDLVTEKEKAEVLKMLKKINSAARIVECQLNDPASRPSIDSLLGTNSFSINRALELDPNFLDSDSDYEDEDQEEESGSKKARSDAKLFPTCGHASDDSPIFHPNTATDTDSPASATHSVAAAETATETLKEGSSKAQGSSDEHLLEPAAAEAHGDHEDIVDLTKRERRPKRKRKKLHDLSDISSVGIVAKGPVDEHRFNMFMRDLLSEKARDIFRTKGILCVHGYGNYKFVFQGVHETICYGPCDKPWKDEESKMNQIVFIGRGLDRRALAEGFRTCIWVPLPDGWEEFRDPKTKLQFYFNKSTGEKRWDRPDDTPVAHVTATHASTEQPASVRPRKCTSI